MEHFLNTKLREKNMFKIFFNQQKSKIQMPKDKEALNKNILLHVTDEEKSNQFENLPIIQNDEIKKLDTQMKNISKNELNLSNEKILYNNDIDLSKDTKGLNIDHHQIDIVKDFKENEIIKDNLKLDKIIQDTVEIKEKKDINTKKEQ